MPRILNSPINLLYNKLIKLYRSDIALRYPAVIKIEVTTDCNLRCPLCFRGAGMMTRKQGRMPFAVFKKVIDEAGKHCTEATLTNLGENFLNQEIYQMIRYAKAKGVKNVSTFSNLLTVSEANIKEIVDSGLDEIIISIDGMDQATYEKFRVGGNFSKVIDNLKFLVEEKKRKNSRKPAIEVQCLLTKDTEKNLPGIYKFLSSLGTDRVAFKALFLYIRDFNHLTRADLENAYRFLPIQDGLRVYRIENDKISWRFPCKAISCMDLWRSITVTWDGKIIPCCFDWDAEYVLGDITEESFARIWNGSNYRKLRSDFLKENVGICKNCPALIFDKFYINIDDYFKNNKTSSGITREPVIQ